MAREHGHPESILITFSNVTWNASSQRSRDLRTMAQLTRGLDTFRDREHRLGVDLLGTRVVLYRSVTGMV